MTASWPLAVPDEFEGSAEDGLVQKQGRHDRSRRGS